MRKNFYFYFYFFISEIVRPNSMEQLFLAEEDNPNLRECYVKCHLVIITPPVVTTTIALFH